MEDPHHRELHEAISSSACLQVQCLFSKADVFAKAPTVDSDPGAAGHLPQGVLSQTGVDAIVLWQGILDVELCHASRTGRVSILDGLLCGGKHSKTQAREHHCCHDTRAHHEHSDPLRANDVSGPYPATWQRYMSGERG